MLDYNKINENLQQDFLRNKGKGVVFAYPPINIGKLLLGTLGKLILKRPNEKVLIVVSDYTYKNEIINVIRDTLELKDALFIEEHIQFLKEIYAYNKLYLYTVNILVNIDNPGFVKKSAIESKFTLCIVTNPKLKLNIVNNIRSCMPTLNIGVGDNDLQTAKINTPVNEYRHPVYLNEEEKVKYDKYSSFIKDSMTVFGSFDNVELCRSGDKITGVSAIQYCTKLANENGWSPELDMSVEFNVQIDRIYNPNAIHERAQLIYNISRERKNFLCNFTNKIPEVIKIVKANPFKRIVIVSKSGEFANEIAEALNKETFTCGLYHNEIPACYMPDSDGNYITYKQGINKGKPKLFKAAALSSYYEELYDTGVNKVLSIKSSSDDKLNIPIDIIIFTTTLVDDIFKFKARFKNCSFPRNSTEIHRIYCNDTIEENVIYKENPSNLITICKADTMESIQIDEERGEIIL